MQINLEKIDRIGWIALKVAAVLIMLSCLVSCRTSQQISKKHLDKALAKDRAFVIDELRKIAPCVTTKDTVLSTEYSTRTDTITETKTVEVTVDCPPNTNGVKVVKTVSYDNTTYLRTDSIFIVKQTTIRDMADSILASITIAKKDKEIAKGERDKTFWKVATIIVSLILIFTWIGRKILSSIPKNKHEIHLSRASK